MFYLHHATLTITPFRTETRKRLKRVSKRAQTCEAAGAPQLGGARKRVTRTSVDAARPLRLATPCRAISRHATSVSCSHKHHFVSHPITPCHNRPQANMNSHTQCRRRWLNERSLVAAAELVTRYKNKQSVLDFVQRVSYLRQVCRLEQQDVRQVQAYLQPNIWQSLPAPKTGTPPPPPPVRPPNAGGGHRPGRGGCTHVMHGRSHMILDAPMPTLSGRSTSGLHRPGRHGLHRARIAGVRCSASRMTGGQHLTTVSKNHL